MAVTHTKISGKSDGPDTTLVRPSDWNADHVVSGIGTTPSGRLSLAATTPVMTTTVSGATTIYYTPYIGNTVPIYDGTNLVPTAFQELSVATTDNTKSPAAIGASKVNDWFVWSDAGTLRIGHGPDWDSDTARSAGTVLVLINGIWLNNSAITNGPALRRGTYVGTTRSNGSSQLDWIYGTLASTGGPSFHGIWNAYNRVDIASLVSDSDDTATFSSATPTGPYPAGMTHSFVSGLAEDVFEFTYNILAAASVSSYISIGLGYDSATVLSGTSGYVVAGSAASTVASFKAAALGFHVINSMVATPAGGSPAIWGDAGTSTTVKTGIWLEGWF